MRFRIDDKEFSKNLKRLWNELEDDLEKEFDNQLTEVETGAKALAPHDEGNLEDDIHKTKVNKTDNSLHGEVHAGGTGSKYAKRMHEDIYTPGPITQGKPDYKGYSPGRKYLENAVKANAKSFLENVKKIVLRHIK